MSKGYRFGPFRLDATRRRLFRDGDSISVPPKALDVLEVLIENRGRTVDKEDLLARVWPDTVVEDANLRRASSCCVERLVMTRRIHVTFPPSPVEGIDLLAPRQTK